ncbi:MAG TPA: N(4)-(beta-N-acetylglucosaminyl)-L-asparaginase [Bryobacteraceae bacterium]|nr:N(4)-(beta-N-acetylglucosaminyl)-L-asparaginase [Bryobacteraceae bacterium]
MITRRNWLAGSGVLAAAAPQAASADARNIVISSSNGLRACARAMEILKSNGDTLDAVIAGVNINEEDPEDDSVGYGGLPNEDGVVELDACVMHGPTRRAGSVAGIRNIKTPSRVAKLVMEQTDHVMLVGAGALKFAKAWGMREENLLTEKSRLAWMVWKKSLRDASGHNNWTDGLDAPPNSKPGAALKRMFPGVSDQLLAYAWDRAMYPPTGTINCLALNSKGEMSGTTTTSGLAWKLAGRVGDSPIIGAGLYVDQEVGGGGSTGRGEENIRVCGAHSIVENMRHGMPPKDACLDVLKRIARNYGKDQARLAKFDISFYALRKDGEYASATLWSATRGGQARPRQFAVNDGTSSRLESCAYLYERK